jgi:hypothetical protein
MKAKPIPNVSDPMTCAGASGMTSCSPADVTARTRMLKNTSAPPAKPVAARPAAPRPSRRSPSSTPVSQISDGSLPLIGDGLPHVGPPHTRAFLAAAAARTRIHEP